MRPRILNSFLDLERHTPTNPAYLDAKKQKWGDEKYTIKEAKSVFFFRRKEAIEYTRKTALLKGLDFTILLNGVQFCKVYRTGRYEYIYDPSMDFLSSPALKQFFIQKGYAIAA